MREKRKHARVFWTRDEKRARERQLEQRYPGYLIQKEKTLVLLGAAVFLRGVYQLMTLMINRTPLVYSLFMFLGLVIVFTLYFFAARSRMIAGCLFGVRIIELMRILGKTLPSLFYFSYLLKIWWVTMMGMFALDLFYLSQPLFHKTWIQQTLYYQMLDSSQPLPSCESLPDLTAFVAPSGTDLGTEAGEDPAKKDNTQR